MLKRSIAFLTCLMLVFPSSGYSWGNKGHQTVGRIAQLFLQEDNAQTTLDKIQTILKPGESLASIATWADTVSDGSIFCNFAALWPFPFVCLTWLYLRRVCRIQPPDY